MLYGLDDITIIPSVVTYIEHRGDCSVNYQETGMLPLFTAPMASVINDKNWELYANQQINTIIPRNIRLSEAPSHGLPICKYDPECVGARSYAKLSEEVIHRG